MNIIEWLVRKNKKVKQFFTNVTPRNHSKAETPISPKSNVNDESYIQDCLQREYDELPENKSADSDPAFKKVLDPLNRGDNIGTCRAAESLIAQYPKFASLYCWWSLALIRMGFLDRARQLLADGIDKVNEKHRLCNRLGEIEWEGRNLNRAVYWWSQGLHCQESLQPSNYGGTEGAYLFLYYVAEGMGLPECSTAFLLRADSIRSVRLNLETANDLVELARNAGTPSVEQVLKELVQNYIIPRKKSETKADPDELRRLICQLEEVANQSRWAEKEKDVKAIERLGELGDPKAIDVLTRVAAHGMLIDAIDAAKKAIDKIKNANR